jgi:Family of unknown function (DUF6338)
VIPEGAGAFVGLLIFVAPGILFEILRERRRPGLEETSFREASRIALSSVAFSLSALLALSLVRLSRPAWMPDPGEWLRLGNGYLKGHYRLIGRAAFLEVGGACVLSLLLSEVLSRTGHGLASIRPISSWYHCFRVERPENTVPYVTVRLKDGTQYMGTLAHYSPDPKMEDRELTLKPPFLKRKGLHDIQAADIATDWQRIIIAAASIDVLTIAYRNIR